MLKVRILTGLALGIAIGLGVLHLSNGIIAVAFALITLGGAWEWSRLMGKGGLPYGIIYMLAIGACLAALWWLPDAGATRVILMLAAVWWGVVLIALCLVVEPPKPGPWLSAGFALSGFLTLVPAWLAMVRLHEQAPPRALFVLLLVWMADTAAFATGRRFGRIKLAPAISPGKTREGLWGAIVACALFALLAGWWLELDAVSWAYFVGLSLLAVLFSVVGDLFESLLKRCAGVKDSGQILPGHGGVLDRIDSLTAAAPVFMLGLYWL